ncbi:MAG: GNAT family N-acetyltransferase [Candidatus Phlomobacter fragariae]
MWAVELRAQKQFIGFVRLNIPAYEAACSVLDFAFLQQQMQEIVSFTARINRSSESLMKKLAMKKDANNFYIRRYHLLILYRNIFFIA